MSLVTKHVHILGLGNVGCFFAHNLQIADKVAPISLLFHRKSLAEEWDNASRRISITTDDSNSSQGTVTACSHAYGIESISPPSSEQSHIHNLIVATKSYQTLEALSAIRHRLTSKSTLLFVQSSLEIISKINHNLFSDPYTRPSYLIALVSHGLFSIAPFKSVYKGQGRVLLGHISEPSAMTSTLVERILAASTLNATYFDRDDLRNFHLEKLIADAIINPLTALFRCRNGHLFWNGIARKPLKKLTKRLVLEINQALFKLDDEIGSIDPDRFAVSNMEIMVFGTARKTRSNLTPMLQDVLRQRQTEIDSINGWIVEEGEKRGVDMQCNKTLIELVKKGEKLNEDQIETHFPGTISCQEMNAWNQELHELKLGGFQSSKKFLYNERKECVNAW